MSFLSNSDLEEFKDFRKNHHRRFRLMDDSYDQCVRKLGSVEKYNRFNRWWADDYIAKLQHAQDNFQKPEEVHDRFVQLVTTHASEQNLLRFEDSFRFLNMPVVFMGAVNSPTNQMASNHFRLVLSVTSVKPMTVWQEDDNAGNGEWMTDTREEVMTGMLSLFLNMDDRAGVSSSSTIRTGDSGYQSNPTRQPRRPMVGPLMPHVFHQLGAVQSTTDRDPHSHSAHWTSTGFYIIVNMYDHHPWLLLNPAIMTNAGAYLLPRGERIAHFPGVPQSFSLARLDFFSPDKKEPQLHRLFYRYNAKPTFSVTHITRCANFWVDGACRNPNTGTVTRIGEPGEPTTNPVELSRARSQYTQQWFGGYNSLG